MAIRKIARLGHPVLRQAARRLTDAEIRSPEVARLVQDMIETMGEYGGIGLAAPQIHESLSLAIIGFDQSSGRYPDMGAQPLAAYFNPTVHVLDPTPQAYWEGCLSVPGLRGRVRRPRKVRIDYQDATAQPQSIVAEGFVATVFQHELDHLSGVLYIDRLENSPGRTELAFTEEYQKYVIPRQAAESGEPEPEVD